ncbi:MAG: hypothetical protein RL386_2117 [Bacteroidota bacterium]
MKKSSLLLGKKGCNLLRDDIRTSVLPWPATFTAFDFFHILFLDGLQIEVLLDFLKFFVLVFLPHSVVIII